MTALVILAASAAALRAQSPTAWRLFNWQTDATYLGAFRVPAGYIAGTNLTFNGTGLAFNPQNNSLFIVSRDPDAAQTLDGAPVGQRVAEISIPQPVNLAGSVRGSELAPIYDLTTVDVQTTSLKTALIPSNGSLVAYCDDRTTLPFVQASTNSTITVACQLPQPPATRGPAPSGAVSIPHNSALSVSCQDPSGIPSVQGTANSLMTLVCSSAAIAPPAGTSPAPTNPKEPSSSPPPSGSSPAPAPSPVPAPAPAPSVGLLNNLPRAAVLQAFVEPTEGKLINATIAGTPTKIRGLLVWNNRLYGTLNSYYDGTNSQTVSHFSRPVNLSMKGDVRGPYAVSAPNVLAPNGPDAGLKTHVYAGWLALIPQAWRALFQGSALTGNCCGPLVTFQSSGPDAFAWDPNQLQNNQLLVTQFYYPPSHPIAGWASTNPVWNGTTRIAGLAFLENTRTVLYIGTHGTGPFCYGVGGAAPPANLAPGQNWCNDPADASQGTHGAPYQYQIWAYDANDLQQVMAGKRAPYSVVPYAVWNFDLPFENPDRTLNGVAYDPATGRLFIEQYRGDTDLPVIHVFQVS